MIEFRFNPKKSLEAVARMLGSAQGPLDFHTILKAAYFADKAMLNAHGRPIFGATYRAMNYGPVPVEIYEMLKCEPLWLAELAREDYPWLRTGYRVALASGSNHFGEPDDIAPVELDLLDRAFRQSQAMTFDERTRETHGMDWVRGTQRAGGRMAYEDMIEGNHPGRGELIAELEAMGPRLVL